MENGAVTMSDCRKYQDYIERFQMVPHVEGGFFRELDPHNPNSELRPAHGVIYYMLDAHDKSDFHVLDSDEYWLYHAGPDIEIWWIDDLKQLHRSRLGMGDHAQPCVLMPAGCIFGARHAEGNTQPILVSCVTVPQFRYEHYRILEKEEVLQICPAAEEFYK